MDNLALAAALRIENNFTTDSYIDKFSPADDAPYFYCLHGAVLAEAAVLTGLALDHNVVSFIATAEESATEEWQPYREAARLAAPTLQRLISVMPIIDKCCIDHAGSAQAVYHYNDVHCDGGEEAAKALREAAEVDLDGES